MLRFGARVRMGVDWRSWVSVGKGADICDPHDRSTSHDLSARFQGRTQQRFGLLLFRPLCRDQSSILRTGRRSIPLKSIRTRQLRYNIASDTEIRTIKISAGAAANCRDGGIGRRAGLRIQCRKACRFESCSRHHKIRARHGTVSPLDTFERHSDQTRVLAANLLAGTAVKHARNYCTCCKP